VKRILCAISLAMVSLAAPGGLAAQHDMGGHEAPSVQVPTIPAPVAVEVEAAKTAFLILDLTEATCAPRTNCVASVPAIASLLARARAANVPVVYSAARSPTTVLAAVAPRANEPLVMTFADKFFQTDLDDILTGLGAETLVIVGTFANGAVLYTAYGANLRGYTVVVAEDGISEPGDFEVFLARYQLLNQPGFNNPENTPLVAGRVTLSRTDLITFR